MDTALLHRIKTLARNDLLADGTPCQTIKAIEVELLAKETGTCGRMVEIAALREGIVPDRYLRNLKTLTVTDQIRLLDSAVLIVGLGGLGGLVSETLARIGVGRFFLVDGDVFEAHNLNRQLFSSMEAIGRPKGEAAVNRLKAINPGLEVTVTSDYLVSENAERLMGPCDLVVDCLDTINARFTLEAAAKRAGIPMVSAAVAGMSGHVTTIYPEDSGLENIYGPPDQLEMTKGAETRLGCLAPGVNLIASLECAEALNVLLQKKKTLRSKLLVVDLTDYTFETLQIA